jgi:AraC-like DNA-binding protein
MRTVENTFLTMTSNPLHPDYSTAARRLLYGVQHKNIPVPPILQQADIPPGLLEQPGGSLRGLQFLRLLQTVKHISEDEFFALTPHRCKPGTFEMMSSTGLHCATLRAFIEHCCQFYYLVSDDVSITFTERGNSAHLDVLVTDRAFDPEQFLAEFLLLNLHRCFSWVTGFMLPLQAVEFSTQETPGPERLLYYLRKDWQAGAAHNRFSFHSKYLGLPLVRTQTELQAHLRDSASDKPIWPQDHQTWSARVRARIRSALLSARKLENIEDTASALNVTSRSLRRHLGAEGSSFQQLLDELRQDIAIEKLHVQHMSVAEVSDLLGFSEPRSFSRAFKQWTGTAPGKYQPPASASRDSGSTPGRAPNRSRKDHVKQR